MKSISRCSSLFLFVGIITTAISCKKDVLHPHSVQKLNSNTSNSLYNVKFVNDSVCIIGGGDTWNQTTVLRSTDGGYSWQSIPFPNVGKAMFGLSLSPERVGVYLCGVDGDVLSSKDNGLNWEFARIGDWMHYVGGTFINKDTGVFVNTVLQKQGTVTQVDSTFNIIDQQTFQFGLNNIYMISASTGYILGYGAVQMTTDYRRSWTVLNVADDNFIALDVHGEEMWMCGYNGSVYHTLDAGIHWDKQRNGNDISIPHYGFLDIRFKDRLNGWVCCDNGKLLYTNDGGNHWMEYVQFTTSALRSIALCPNGDLLLVGDNGSIYRVTP